VTTQCFPPHLNSVSTVTTALEFSQNTTFTTRSVGSPHVDGSPIN